VADASVIPRIPSANTNLTTIAVAERIAGWLAGTEPADHRVGKPIPSAVDRARRDQRDISARALRHERMLEQMRCAPRQAPGIMLLWFGMSNSERPRGSAERG
jgi:hypothetical protein